MLPPHPFDSNPHQLQSPVPARTENGLIVAIRQRRARGHINIATVDQTVCVSDDLRKIRFLGELSPPQPLLTDLSKRVDHIWRLGEGNGIIH